MKQVVALKKTSNSIDGKSDKFNLECKRHRPLSFIYSFIAFP